MKRGRLKRAAVMAGLAVLIAAAMAVLGAVPPPRLFYQGADVKNPEWVMD